MAELKTAAAGLIVSVALAGCAGDSGSSVTWVATELGRVGTVDQVAEAINDHGQIVGWRGDREPGAQALLWEGGKITDLGSLPGRRYSYAADINERGQIVGTSWGESYASSGHAFLWDAGRMIDLGTLGGATSFAMAINDHGQIVGTSWAKSGDMRAFLWKRAECLTWEHWVARTARGTTSTSAGR